VADIAKQVLWNEYTARVFGNKKGKTEADITFHDMQRAENTDTGLNVEVNAGLLESMQEYSTFLLASSLFHLSFYSLLPLVYIVLTFLLPLSTSYSLTFLLLY
jgi:hypothetical protein